MLSILKFCPKRFSKLEKSLLFRNLSVWLMGWGICVSSSILFLYMLENVVLYLFLGYGGWFFKTEFFFCVCVALAIPEFTL